MTGRPTSPRHAEALALAGRGIPVFPCQVGGKKPATGNGFKDETTDLGQIDRWWSEADWNLGVRPVNLGLVALDLDIAKPGEVDPDTLATLPDTRTHQTPSGGLHKFYRSAEKFGNHKLAVNVDVRSHKGYVLWPPSVVAGVEYQITDRREPAPLPEPVAAVLRAKQNKRSDTEAAAAVPRASRGERTGVDAVEIYDIGLDIYPAEAEAWLAARDPIADHPGRFKLAATLVRNFGLSNKTATELCLKYGFRITPSKPDGTPWPLELQHVRQYGQGELGQGPAWQPPPPREDVPPEIDAAAAAMFAERKAKAQSRRHTPEEAAYRPPLDYWDGKKLLPKGIPAVGFAYGSQGSHKTGLFIKLGLDAIEQHGAKVLYIAAEDAYGFEIARLPTAREARGMSWEKLNAHWCTDTETFNLLRPEDHQGLWDTYADFKPDMIFIDVFAKVAVGDINSPEFAAKAMYAAGLLAERFGCPVGLAGHPGKDIDRGLMGSYLFEALAYFMWKVSHSTGKVFVTVQKLKNGPADRTEVFATDMSGGAPVVIDAPAEVQPKVGQVPTEHKLTPVIRKFLDGLPKAENEKGMSANGLARQLRPTLPNPDAYGTDAALAKTICRIADTGELNGYFCKHEGSRERCFGRL
jgi:hypothetical protein